MISIFYNGCKHGILRTDCEGDVNIPLYNYLIYRPHRIMNSMWAVDKIIVKRDINISLAVGTEDSVLTPVIKNADHKNVAGLAKEIDELARKTREGKLTLSDMQSGTF